MNTDTTMVVSTAPDAVEAVHVSSFLKRNGHLTGDCSATLGRFLAESAKLCTAITIAPEAAYAGSKEFDAMMPSFINGLPLDLRRAVFRAKLLDAPERLAIFVDFLRDACGETDITPQDIELVDVKDLSTGRARVAGHVVYRILLRLYGSQTKTVYLKGFGAKEYETLTKAFDGWQNRKSMYRYEEFCQKAANIAGVSKIHSRFYREPLDSDFHGFTLAEEIRGTHSNELFEVNGAIAEIKPEFLPHLSKLLKRVAGWHAFADLMGKADRRFLQLTPGYSRPTNYLIDVPSLEIEGVDHEYLFSPPTLVKFELANRHSEMAILVTLPESVMPAALRHYADCYIDSWNALMKGGAYQEITTLAGSVFGAESVESTFLAGASDRDPERSLRALWEDIRNRTQEKSLVPFPSLAGSDC